MKPPVLPSRNGMIQNVPAAKRSAQLQFDPMTARGHVRRGECEIIIISAATYRYGGYPLVKCKNKTMANQRFQTHDSPGALNRTQLGLCSATPRVVV